MGQINPQITESSSTVWMELFIYTEMNTYMELSIIFISYK